MSEGPQVKLRTHWLDKWLVGRTVVSAQGSHAPAGDAATSVTGRRIEACFCKGKHIFIAFDSDIVIHNHLLMSGKWRKLPGQQLFLADNVWLALYVGPYTVCNIKGQMLRFRQRDELREVIADIGPDVMGTPLPREEVISAWSHESSAITEVLLDQRVASGIGNVARSEALFLAGIDPRTPGTLLSSQQLDALWTAVQKVMWDSYNQGGRWKHRVYQRTGQRCDCCGTRIQRLRLPPTKRSSFFCPSCQR